MACLSAGTLDYLAPEMLRNPSNDLEEGWIPQEQLDSLEITPYGPSIDIWAVGIIAYELVAGSAPFTLCGDEQQTMRRILEWNDIAFPRALSPQWADFVRCVLHTICAARSLFPCVFSPGCLCLFTGLHLCRCLQHVLPEQVCTNTASAHLRVQVHSRMQPASALTWLTFPGVLWRKTQMIAQMPPSC